VRSEGFLTLNIELMILSAKNTRFKGGLTTKNSTIQKFLTETNHTPQIIILLLEPRIQYGVEEAGSQLKSELPFPHDRRKYSG
jgi:hypothetical protein